MGLGPAQAAARAELLTETCRRLEECPTPPATREGLREVLGDELQAPLVGLSLPSLRRWTKGGADLPGSGRPRLHGQALLIDHPEGSENTEGIRRWLQRPLSALGGRAPRDQLLGLAEGTRLGLTAG
ncbi:antitoxin Xre/MbcA/ParS toxin-binding domain-containing protein [Cyanobium sp. Morenito 9A2]|uniref:antitoxin Xre/MbcA/ParS toxin-binding domain-containing protein n=1 Tax=Cyanobium sp. Morenito 9A2 TaxID=2823718 RepID=UPI0020CBC9A4|nr:antitoxin Xre/MbcA/ParS toxin-binding domain-containing protein [Cyanobium sp. Morenito 9A2]MCP9848773.1 DUF2384 domain-containing protein [Cyanobium sp. Morenito 9A2]